MAPLALGAFGITLSLVKKVRDKLGKIHKKEELLVHLRKRGAILTILKLKKLPKIKKPVAVNGKKTKKPGAIGRLCTKFRAAKPRGDKVVPAKCDAPPPGGATVQALVTNPKTEPHVLSGAANGNTSTSGGEQQSQTRQQPARAPPGGRLPPLAQVPATVEAELVGGRGAEDKDGGGQSAPTNPVREGTKGENNLMFV